MNPQSPSLQQLYERDLKPDLTKLEAKRIEIRNRSLLIGAISLVVIAIAGGFFGQAGFIVSGILAVIIGAVVTSGPMSEYRQQFKEQLIGRLIATYHPGIDYDPHRGISRNEFQQSQIYRHRIDRYKGEDLLTGIVEKTAFRFSEVHAEYKTTTTDSKGRRRTHWHTIFFGLFLVADFNKSFAGLTLVVPDQAERHFGGIGKMLQSWGAKLGAQPGELVKLEDPEFEQLFAVYAADQVEARYILSTSLMQRLVAFQKQMNKPIALSFVNANLHLAISTRKNYFEPPSIWTGSAMLALEDVKEYLADLKMAQDIIEDLNLNLRIWGKQ